VPPISGTTKILGSAEESGWTRFHGFVPTLDTAIQAYAQTDEANKHGKIRFELAVQENEKHQAGDEHRQQEGIDQPERFLAFAMVPEQDFQAGITEPGEKEQSPNAKWDDKCQDTLVVTSADQG